MPRRTSARITTSNSAPPQQISLRDASSENVSVLGTQWKWAAFSQFFFTFSHLFAMSDVTLTDIEHDLVQGTNTVLSRIVQRLLYTLTYDRKAYSENWQMVLRKQFLKRDPAANPLGPQPTKPSTSTAFQAGAEVDHNTEVVEGVEVELDYSRSGSEKDRSISMESTRDITGESAVQKTNPDLFHEYYPEHCTDNSRDQHQYISVNWLDLPILVKLDSLHLLMEWQFQNPMRLRTLMKSDDENASWRIEPIGFDSKHNAYWLIGADRLWIQRVIPKTNKTLKRKRDPANQSKTLASNRMNNEAKKRRRLQPDVFANPPSINTGQGRVAKARAKLKMNAQAKELAELNNQAKMFAEAPQKGTRPGAQSRPVGTRISARLRGLQEDEWQPIPDEWLEGSEQVTSMNGGSKTSKLGREPPKTGLESDISSISDLTESTEETEVTDSITQIAHRTTRPSHDSLNDLVTEQEIQTDVLSQLEGFVEWEVICASLHEWENISKRFEKATHRTEKALYKILVNHIVPFVVEELREAQKKRRLEEALVQRKRSSRIALKESEKAEAALAAKKKVEEIEKMSRARRLEARMQKEETDRIKRETAREQRRKEREAREHAKDAPNSLGPQAENDDNCAKNQLTIDEKQEIQSLPQIDHAKSNGYVKTDTRTPIGDDWELDCEICRRRGINVDDGTPMMSCGSCSKWQHIFCHDRADRHAGRPKRDWDVVDFLCLSCYSKATLSSASSAVLSNGSHISSAQLGNVETHRPQLLSPNRQEWTYGGSHYQQSSFTSLPYQLQPAETSAISFSHYQPQERGFSSSAKLTHHQKLSQPTSGTGYGFSSSHLTRYAGSSVHPASSLRSQYTSPVTPTVWNITTPAHAPGHSSMYGTQSRDSTSSKRNDNADVHQTFVNDQGRDSRLHVEVPPQLPTTQFRYHSTSHQPPL